MAECAAPDIPQAACCPNRLPKLLLLASAYITKSALLGCSEGSSHLKCTQYFNLLSLFFPLLTFHSTCTTGTFLPLPPPVHLMKSSTSGPRPFIPPLSEHRSSESTVSSVMLSRSHTLFPTLVPHHGAPSCPFSPSALEVVSGTAPPAPNPDPFTCSPGSPVSPKATAGHPPWSILVLTGSR